MPPINKWAFVREHARRRDVVDRDGVRDGVDRVLADESAPTREAVRNKVRQADVDGDGFIRGPRELNRLFKAVDRVDRDGDEETVTPGEGGRLTSSGKMLDLLRANTSAPAVDQIEPLRVRDLDAAAGRIAAYRQHVIAAAEKHDLPPAVVAGVIYQESKGKPDAGGSRGLGSAIDLGLMQINVTYNAGKPWYGEFIDGGWQRPDFAIDKGCEILADMRRYLQNKNSSEVAAGRPARISDDEILRATLAAYNSGGSGTWSQAGKTDVEWRTTNQDYATKVLIWAQYFAERHPELFQGSQRPPQG